MVWTRNSPIGLDVGSRWIKAAQLRRAKGGAWELRAGLRVRRTGPGGPLTGDEAARIGAMLSRQGFVGTDVVLGVPPGMLAQQVMELPPRQSGAPLDQIARTELARQARCPVNAMEACWWELPSGARASEGTHVMGLAVPHAAAEALIDACRAGGLFVEALDAPTLASARACAGEQGLVAAGVTMLVDLGWTGATIALFVGDVLVYERRLDHAGLGQAFDQLREKFELADDVASYLIEHVGVLQTPAPGAPGGVEAPEADDARSLARAALLGEAREVIVQQVHAVFTEVHASQSYAQRRFAQAGAELTILMCGGGTSVPGLGELFRRELGMDAGAGRGLFRVCVPAECLPTPSPTELAEDPSLMQAIGLAMHPGAGAAQAVGAGVQGAHA